MNLTKLLVELHREREEMDHAIISLEKLAKGRRAVLEKHTSAKRLGRPPGSKNKRAIRSTTGALP